jgi:hypothetical protein
VRRLHDATSAEVKRLHDAASADVRRESPCTLFPSLGRRYLPTPRFPHWRPGRGTFSLDASFAGRGRWPASRGVLIHWGFRRDAPHVAPLAGRRRSELHVARQVGCRTCSDSTRRLPLMGVRGGRPSASSSLGAGCDATFTSLTSHALTLFILFKLHNIRQVVSLKQ